MADKDKEKKAAEEPETPVEKPVVKATDATTVDAQKFAEMETRFAALEAENAANKAAAEAQAAEVKKLSEANAKLTDDAETMRFTEEVEGKTKESKHAYVGDAAAHLKHMKSLAKAFGEDSEEFKHYLATQRQSATLAANSLLMREMGASGVDNETTAYGKLVALAKEHQSKNANLTFEQSFAEVMSQPQHKDLYQQYTEEGN